MLAIFIIIVSIVAFSLLRLWIRHRYDTVDDYFEREDRDPPAGMPPTW